MPDPIAWVAVALAVVAVVGSLLPGVPGPALSLVAVYLYWWSTGYADPGTLVLAALTLVALFALAVDWLAGFVSAKAGGASLFTSVAAGVVGLALFFVAGPLGVVAGVAGTVFVLELARNSSVEDSGRAALYTTIGMLASTVVQFLLTLSILVAFLLVVFL